MSSQKSSVTRSGRAGSSKRDASALTPILKPSAKKASSRQGSQEALIGSTMSSQDSLASGDHPGELHIPSSEEVRAMRAQVEANLVGTNIRQHIAELQIDESEARASLSAEISPQVQEALELEQVKEIDPLLPILTRQTHIRIPVLAPPDENLLALHEALRDMSVDLPNWDLHLQRADQLSAALKDEASIRCWALVSPMIRDILKYKARDYACLVANTFMLDPTSISGVVNSFSTLKTLLPNDPLLAIDLESTVSSMCAMMKKFIKDNEAQDDELGKFNNQINTVSKVVAEFQETVEKIILAWTKIDVTPKSTGPSPIAVSLPSTSGPTSPIQHQKVSFDRDATYHGPYCFTVKNGAIASIITPNNHPEIIGITLLKTNAQEMFINLNQEKILNKIANTGIRDLFETPESRAKLADFLAGIPYQHY